MESTRLTLSDFQYELPESLIAHEPLLERSGSRLLIRHKTGKLEHSSFRNLSAHLEPGTLLLYNDSRVLPGRLLGHTPHGGKIELMLLRPIAGQGNCWEALGRPFRKLHEGFQIQFPGNCSATVLRQELNDTQPYVEVSFDLAHEEFSNWLDHEGYVPLPPYISRPDVVSAEQSPDRERYQTVYAVDRGSVAAPTAGLHFDKKIWEELHEAGIQTAPVTLHVGGGTFLPVKSAEISRHRMHKESFRMSHRTFDCINLAIKDGRPIVAVGTTTLRCVESFARLLDEKGSAEALDRWLETDLFIYPKFLDDTYQPWAIKGILTNFHQPESSLLMLISSLVGYASMKKIYSEAVTQKYRFLSYGDTSLLWF